ncbi:mitochondrial carrier [Macrolepiota fuliginosa MF-IS2]|uniref:Mitochondrial carrier n=1 Tax=Macrolepiota fuliginosa MF-IS2 TaxID=1400762 RepID=A0A9P5X9T9_9AGAR|nr:mitochondrial carrier [Macrolepiota fuliginosa MF-IS2]
MATATTTSGGGGGGGGGGGSSPTVSAVGPKSAVADGAGQAGEVQVKRAGFMFVTPEVASYFIAGGCAGAASRTVVSPLERLKIIQQVQPKGSNSSYNGVWNSLVRMWREEGFKGFMRGNGINCLRIVPYSAVQFTTYEQLKKWFTRHGSKELDTPKRLAAGALAGITSVCNVGSTYPLDLVRSRLSIATASVDFVSTAGSATASSGAPASIASSTSPAGGVMSVATKAKANAALASGYHTSSPFATAASAVSGATRTVKARYTAQDLTTWGMTLKVMREEGGVKGLYRGLITTAFGVAPYVGINFAAYEALRGVITPPGKTSVWRKLACGALAGSISQTLTYPFDVLRRKMQVTGMQGGPKYNGALDALRSVVRSEGVRGLYRGLWPNLLKVAPSIATSFFTYELVSILG